MKTTTVYELSSDRLSESNGYGLPSYYSTRKEAEEAFRTLLKDAQGDGSGGDNISLSKLRVAVGNAEAVCNLLGHSKFCAETIPIHHVSVEFVETEDNYVPKVIWYIKDGFVRNDGRREILPQ